MLVNMKLDSAKLKYQYELALEEFERERRRAYAVGRPVSKGISAEYLRAYRAYEVESEKVCDLEFTLCNCQSRTVSSEASENPSEDFHRQPSSV